MWIARRRPRRPRPKNLRSWRKPTRSFRPFSGGLPCAGFFSGDIGFDVPKPRKMGRTVKSVNRYGRHGKARMTLCVLVQSDQHPNDRARTSSAKTRAAASHDESAACFGAAVCIFDVKSSLRSFYDDATRNSFRDLVVHEKNNIAAANSEYRSLSPCWHVSSGTWVHRVKRRRRCCTVSR